MKQFIQSEDLADKHFVGYQDDSGKTEFEIKISKQEGNKLKSLDDGLFVKGSEQTTPSSSSNEQDTGWYDITNIVKVPDNVTKVDGRIFFRRIGKTCYLNFDSYRWNVVASTHTFFPEELCKYTHPYWEITNPGVRLRFGGWLPADNRNATAFIYDWLGRTSFRFVSISGLHRTYSSCSWLTDTPFPEEKDLVGTKIIPNY